MKHSVVKLQSLKDNYALIDWRQRGEKQKTPKITQDVWPEQLEDEGQN